MTAGNLKPPLWRAVSPEHTCAEWVVVLSRRSVLASLRVKVASVSRVYGRAGDLAGVCVFKYRIEYPVLGSLYLTTMSMSYIVIDKVSP